MRAHRESWRTYETINSSTQEGFAALASQIIGQDLPEVRELGKRTQLMSNIEHGNRGWLSICDVSHENKLSHPPGQETSHKQSPLDSDEDMEQARPSDIVGGCCHCRVQAGASPTEM